jgi:uncharacterized membrane protein
VIDLIGEGYAQTHGVTFAYTMIATLEEGLEMAGVIVFIATLLNYFKASHQQLDIRLDT